jgi:hypothetical protein
MNPDKKCFLLQLVPTFDRKLFAVMYGFGGSVNQKQKNTCYQFVIDNSFEASVEPVDVLILADEFTENHFQSQRINMGYKGVLLWHRILFDLRGDTNNRIVRKFRSNLSKQVCLSCPSLPCHHQTVHAIRATIESLQESTAFWELIRKKLGPDYAVDPKTLRMPNACTVCTIDPYIRGIPPKGQTRIDTRVSHVIVSVNKAFV